MTPSPWTYQPPYIPSGFPDQRYYRAGLGSHSVDLAGLDAPKLTIYRHGSDESADIEVEFGSTSFRFKLPAAAVHALSDALSDAYQDIKKAHDDRERAESFDRISEELHESGGGPGCYYAHPDVHYVPRDRIKAKVADLKASGAMRFIVLAEDEQATAE